MQENNNMIFCVLVNSHLSVIAETSSKPVQIWLSYNCKTLPQTAARILPVLYLHMLPHLHLYVFSITHTINMI